MGKIRFKIDEKSLYLGTFNDYIRGQTATVSTPLNQSKDEKKWRKDILALANCSCNVKEPPEMLLFQCTKSSHSGNNIDNIFVFSKIYLDGVKLNTSAQFAMYFKRETDEYVKKQNGSKVKNTHLGRIKLHYPISFSFKADGYKIDNYQVLNDIMKQNGGFAYIVRGFEYDNENGVLNFITSLIGPYKIPLSTVFSRKKGVGQKLMIDPNKVSDINECVAVIEEIPKIDGTINISYELINKSRFENGKLGEEIVYNFLLENLPQNCELYHTSLDYPQSPYDMEYIINGQKKYVEVKSTSGNKTIFNMSFGEIKFMEKYKDSYTLYMVTNVKNDFPTIKEYTYKDIMKMKKEYPTVRFFG